MEKAEYQEPKSYSMLLKSQRNIQQHEALSYLPTQGLWDFNFLTIHLQVLQFLEILVL